MAREAAQADRGGRAAERHRARRQALIAYFDTSSFVKLLVPEDGAAEAAAAWLHSERRVSSLMLYPETRAALARARRMGRLGPRQVRLARRRIEALWAAIDRIELTAPLAYRAGDLAEVYGLRAYDAVHLASAMSVADTDVVLVAADADLLAAASSVGLTTIRHLG
ncbi:MAG: type II toxin-antitoxin system VapC family toxin [Solirubrobacteraceae bacterium]